MATPKEQSSTGPSSVLGSSIPALNRPAEPTVRRPQPSPIYLVPVDDDYDCDRLMNEIFSFPKNKRSRTQALGTAS